MRKRFFLFLALCILGSASISVQAALIIPIDSVRAKDPDPKMVAAALEEFRSLSKKEKKDRFKLLKTEWKHYKKARKQDAEANTNTLLLAIVAILLPPLAVYLHQGEINTKFWISLVLSLLAFVALALWIIPVLYALLVILNVL